LHCKLQGLTHFETRTLECPLPEPVLEIDTAVLLSWSEIEKGFTVECAPTPEGPWTNLAASYFLQDGSHAVSVPTGGDQKYFRLVNQ